MWNTSSQRGLLFLLVIMIFITIIAHEYWKFWFVPTLWIFFWWLADCMFLEEGMFLYEPNLDYWKEANEEDY